MKFLTRFISWLLLLLGLLSMGMAVIGLSLTPLVLGGILMGLGILILQIQRLTHSLLELVAVLRLQHIKHENTDTSS